MRRGFVFVLVLLAFIGPASAARLALVIGNAAYEHTVPLKTPGNDAEAFAYFLSVNDFKVTEINDVSRAEMAAALQAFAESVQQGDTAVLYYAGHGIQLGGENYLLGTDAKLANEFDVAAESIGLSQIIRQLETRARITMVFIDACRDNPLAQNLQLAGTRGLSVGLAPVTTSSEGTMVAFAASPGNVAYDGDTLSPFTRALIDHLGEPELEVATAFKRVIRDVREATGGKQMPQVVSTMSLEFYFNEDAQEAGITLLDEGTLEVAVPEEEQKPTTTTQVADVPPTPPVKEPEPPPAVKTPSAPELDFAAAKRLGSQRVWQLFLIRYPSSVLYGEATKELSKLLEAGTGEPKDIEDRLLLSAETRQAVQAMLNARGYLVGAVDGAFGPATRREIAKFQTDNGEDGTGYLTARTFSYLRVRLNSTVAISSDRAKSYNVSDLSRLETEPRLLKAVKCLAFAPLIYGYFEGHLYIAVRGDGDFSLSKRRAEACGGHLVTITSKAENEFVFSLISKDPGFFYFDRDGDDAWVSGPLIGLFQSSKSREPGGNWEWVTGEKVSFNGWGTWQPDNHEGREDFAHFWMALPTGTKAENILKVVKPGWNDAPGGNGWIMEVE